MGEREEHKRKSTDVRRPNVGFWQFCDWAQAATKNGIVTNKQANVTQSMWIFNSENWDSANNSRDSANDLSNTGNK